MAHALLTPDPDPVDRVHGVDLADAGLPGFGVGVIIGPDGEQRFAILKYGQGEADYWPDWRITAPHDVIDWVVYHKEP